MCLLQTLLPDRSWMIFGSVACTMSDQYNSLFAVLKAGPRTITGFQRTLRDPSHTVVCLLPPRQLKGATIMLECVTGLLGGVSVDRLRTLCPFFCRPSCWGVPLTHVSDSSFIITLLLSEGLPKLYHNLSYRSSGCLWGLNTLWLFTLWGWLHFGFTPFSMCCYF